MSIITTNAEQASALAHFNAVAAIHQPNGVLLIQAGSVRDHADMRADQLSSLLQLCRLDGGGQLRLMSDDRQLSVLWLAQQLADDLGAVLPLIADEVRQEARA